MPPTGRTLIGWGSYIIEPAPPGDDSVPSPVQGSFHISKYQPNGGRNPSYLESTPPPMVWKPQFHWLESMIGSSSTAGPHPGMRMIEAHQPMGSSSVAHGEDGAISPVQKSSESLQPQQRGNYDDDLPGRYTSSPRTACQPRFQWLVSRDWLVDFDPIRSQLFRLSRVFSHISRIRQNMYNASALQRVICMIGRTNKRFSAYIGLECRASTLKVRMRNT